MRFQRILRVFTQTIMALGIVLGLVFSPAGPQAVQAVPPAAKTAGVSIAYVYYGANTVATDFELFIEGIPGYGVTLVPLANVAATDFSSYSMVIIADDTGMLNDWGAGSATDIADQLSAIEGLHVPILGLGEGGYAFFGKLGLDIGWPHGWHGPQKDAFHGTYASSIFSGLPDPVTLYNLPVNTVGIYLTSAPAAVDYGLETNDPTKGHADQVSQDCRFLWGNGGSASDFATDGKTAFTNVIHYMVQFQCPSPPVEVAPKPGCVNIVKTANPSGNVTPGTVIAYTLTYTLNPGQCSSFEKGGVLTDVIPVDTVYVPGSASGGAIPSAAGELNWNVGLTLVSPLVETFKVVVAESQCVNKRMVNNTATLKVNGFLPVTSSVHNAVDCPAVNMPNNSTFYAEDELTISPYPLIAGTPSRVSLRLVNSGSLAESVSIDFQAAPLGIGQVYTTFNTQTTSIPAGGIILLTSSYLPLQSGQASFQALIRSALPPTRFTQSNLDVSENFVPGVEDTLTIPLRNDTGSPITPGAPMSLVVDNTCPGWSATVSPTTITDLAVGAVYSASDVLLHVTPPVGPALGSGCHIDLQAWVGSNLVGGIRKLDVPPVHLPMNVNPPWEEPEISFTPDPPVLGVAGQVCVQLTNPLPVNPLVDNSKTVTVSFSEADFGAGIGFTLIGTQNFVLPPNTTNHYCIPWTPSVSGTLHRCLLVTLHQDGFMDMHSQRNVDVLRSVPAGLGTFDYQFMVGNPDGVAHALKIVPTAVGIDPYWHPVITLNPAGDPPPQMLAANATQKLHLRFSNGILIGLSLGANPPPPMFGFGAASQVNVAVLLDGRQVGGFTVQLDMPRLFLPVLVH